MKRWRGCSILLVISLLVVVGYVRYGEKWYQHYLIERVMDVPIPHNATNVKHSASHFQATSFFLKFDIPSADLDIFLSELCFPAKADLKENYRFTQVYYLSDWWMPDEAISPIGEFCRRTDGSRFEILIDTKSTMIYTVYLVGSGE